MRLIMARTVGQTNSSTLVLVKSEKVLPGEWWVLDFAALYNESGESVTHQWAIVRGPTVVLISADNTIADGKAVGTNILPLLMEEEEFAAVVTGSAKAGKVTLVLSAHTLPSLESPARGE